MKQLKYYYDIHIHSCLSPCADKDMTPNNIVNMARLKELDILAVTDHNCAANAAAVIACANRAGLCALAGMEVESAEEIHLLTLFADLKSCLRMEKIVTNALPRIKNNTAIFGQQLIADEEDEIVGSVENLLVTATALTVEQVFKAAEELGGVCIPAHVDRESYSILTTFGVMPSHLDFPTIEVSPGGVDKGFAKDSLWMNQYRVITSSDAHYLWDIAERQRTLELGELSPEAVIKCLKSKKTE